MALRMSNNAQADVLICFTTCPDDTVATRIAENLVAKHLAACVNILPNVRSVYQWQGKIESENEVVLIIKTTQMRYRALQSALTEQHPYELPELVAVSLSAGLPAYLDWVVKETGKAS